MKWQEHIEAWRKKLEARQLLLKERAVLPKLSPEEKQLILAKAREYVEASFSGAASVAPLTLPSGIQQYPIDMDICFWVRGQIRASMIVAEQLPLHETLRRATQRSLSDRRFAPLRQEELSELRIECTLMGGPWEELTQHARARNEIEPERGMVALRGKSPVGWYIPAVHNCVRFRSLDQMLTSLLRNKAKLPKAVIPEILLATYPTTGFIENDSHTGCLDMRGPIVCPAAPPDPRSILDAGLAALLRLERSPGLFETYLSPVAREQSVGTDWPRLAFTGFVLAETGRMFSRSALVEASESMEQYLRSKLPLSDAAQAKDSALASIYAALASLARGERDLAAVWMRTAETSLPLENMGPIARLHGARVLSRSGEEASLDRAKRIFSETLLQWQRLRKSVQLALYPELVPLALDMFGVTGDERYRSEAQRIGEWYAAQQQPDGSFPITPGRTFAYTRGTGKVFEVLALLPEQRAQVMERTLEYLASMQYTDENMFHISPDLREQFRDHFRHDAFDRSVWSDATGHVVLGLARLVNREQGAGITKREGREKSDDR